MTFSVRNEAILLAAIFPMLLLSSCVSLGSKPPPSLLLLTASVKVADGAVNGGTQKTALVVLTPTAPRKLDSNRLPVQINTVSVAYVKDAVWSDKPAALMQQLLIETIAAKNGRFLLNEADAGGLAEESLSGDLVEFGIDATRNEAVVIFDAVRMVRGQPLQTRRFSARRTVAVIEAIPVSMAINEAANEVAGEIAVWLQR